MGFSRFVEIGRVAYVAYGPEEGKLCVILNVIDNKRALVDGPEPITGLARQQMPFKRLRLTDFVIPNLGCGILQASLVKAFQKENILAKWEATSWAKKMAVKKQKASLNDFERFKAMRLKQKRNAAIRKKVAELSK